MAKHNLQLILTKNYEKNYFYTDAVFSFYNLKTYLSAYFQAPHYSVSDSNETGECAFFWAYFSQQVANWIKAAPLGIAGNLSAPLTRNMEKGIMPHKNQRQILVGMQYRYHINENGPTRLTLKSSDLNGTS